MKTVFLPMRCADPLNTTMRNYIIALALLGIIVTPAFAQQISSNQAPTAQAMHVTVDWQNLQTSVGALLQSDTMNIATISKLQNDAAALAEYWKQYVAGLKPTK